MTLFMAVPATIQFTMSSVMITLTVAMVTITSRPALVTIPLLAAKAMTSSMKVPAAMKLLSTILATVMIQSITMATVTVTLFSLAME